MQKFETIRQPLLWFWITAVTRSAQDMYACLRRIYHVEKYNKNSGHLRLCQQPRAAHALRSDQFPLTPMGVLAHRLRTLDRSLVPPSAWAEIFWRTCLQSHLQSRMGYTIGIVWCYYTKAWYSIGIVEFWNILAGLKHSVELTWFAFLLACQHNCLCWRFWLKYNLTVRWMFVSYSTVDL